MRWESAVRAMTSEDLLPAPCLSPSAMRCLTDTPSTGSATAVISRRSPIQVLTAVDVATPPGKAVVICGFKWHVNRPKLCINCQIRSHSIGGMNR
jgi:hypothetical protein